ncbi:tyrosine-type recombinase/integrase [Planctomicrobium sp. SH527]|uniref:tyrosine-type recombinase/integrase n=1 Tax=Planctomicrobium sp. SH527 TaxID=3448123 RepID=UPI003F5C7CFC
MRQKLYKHGLIAQPEKPQPKATIADFTHSYIERHSGTKPATKTVWKRCRRLLVACFGESTSLQSIGVGEAKDFRHWMLREGNQKTPGTGLQENTVRKMCSVAAQFFADAADRKLVAVNPFTHKDIPRTTKENRSRDYFLSREDAETILQACPDTQWRLLFALSRYGGLRCPSEHLSLKWEDVDWKAGRFTVRSPKTEHHEGKESRVVPIFPELLPYLQAAFDESQLKSGSVITRYRSTEANLRTQLHKIIRRAGLEPWPKVFHNLRASRETELAAEHPIHVVCAWIGNSPTVAARHYLTVTESDFTNALKAHHFARQNRTENEGTDVNRDTEGVKKSRKSSGKCVISLRKEGKRVVATGLEPVTSCV